MKKFFKRTGLLLAAAFIGAAAMQAQKSPQDMDRFIDALMKRMTVEEKIGQLNLPVTGEITTGQAKSSDVAKKIEQGLVGGLFNLKGVDKIRDVQKLAVENSRLGIPLLFGMDVIHGYETIFPIPLGLSCTWDMAAIRESARIAAIEASADGISWTFSPMVDISRDPRWGRVSEGSGEDPFLGGAIAKAMVYGYQGANLSDQLKRNDEILSCVKHFALYGAGEAGRDYNTVDMSRNRMFNEYMYPYEAAVEAGVGSVMASFNEIDGVPATANKWLMTDVLRKQRLCSDRLYRHIRDDRTWHRRPASSFRPCPQCRGRYGYGERRICGHAQKVRHVGQGKHEDPRHGLPPHPRSQVQAGTL